MVSGAESVVGRLRTLSSCAPERRPACVADATTINRQGSDVGSQFRSAIFYDPSDLEDKDTCMEAMWEERPTNGRHVVTAMEDRSIFYRAEE
jgi:peptide methionine sulfoxide reductase MsrA